MNLPTDNDRLVILGATGSGKTQAALWHLSMRNYHQMPWTVYNFKSDESIDSIPGAKFIGLDELPTRPGIYVAHPRPDDKDGVRAHMWAIWNRGEHGIYVDEGFMIGLHNDAFRTLLTQGRSLEIPMITLSQRPKWMDKFVFSEGNYYQVFRLQHKSDIKAAEEFVPANLGRRLPAYHSYYYDVANDSTVVMKPVPDMASIHATFDTRLGRLKKVV